MRRAVGGSLLHIPWTLCGHSDVVVAQPVSSQERLANEAQNGEPTGVGLKRVSRVDSGGERLGEAWWLAGWALRQGRLVEEALLVFPMYSSLRGTWEAARVVLEVT